MSIGMHYNKGDYDLKTYMTNPEVFDVTEGMISLLEGPGLGIEIDEALVRKQAQESEGWHWRNPTWRGPGGDIREW